MPPATRQLCRADILAALPQPDALLASGPAVRSCLYDVKLLVRVVQKPRNAMPET